MYSIKSISETTVSVSSTLYNMGIIIVQCSWISWVALTHKLTPKQTCNKLADNDIMIPQTSKILLFYDH